MDGKDRLLLTYLQNGLPLTPGPFAVWAAKLGTDNADLLVRIQRLKREGTFGGIKAVLDLRSFHYQSAWVALRIGEKRHLPPNAASTSGGNFEIPDSTQVSPEAALKDWPSAGIFPGGIESRTEALWQHPGVIYGCEREHEFNVWFFIAVPANHDLELHVHCLEKILGAEEILFLPVRKIFKGSDLLSSLGTETFSMMNERFEKRRTVRASDLPARLGQERHLSPNATSASCGNFEISNRSQVPAEAALKDCFSAEEIGMIRQLQEPFPLTDEPYQKIAADLGITETQVLERMRSLVRKGCLKKIGSFLKSVSITPEARTLVVWQIPEEKLGRIGSEIAAFREVLYADQRPVYPNFPYSFYTMIRGETPEELELITRRMQDRIGKWPHRVMVTVRELKKERMKYFPKDLDVWWQQSRHIAETAFN
jgi:DNA-binding Lrp family transcriptional regulator